MRQWHQGKEGFMKVTRIQDKKADESLEDYVNAMLEERKGINNIYMQVVCSNSRYQRRRQRQQEVM